MNSQSQRVGLFVCRGGGGQAVTSGRATGGSCRRCRGQRLEAAKLRLLRGKERAADGGALPAAARSRQNRGPHLGRLYIPVRLKGIRTGFVVYIRRSTYGNGASTWACLCLPLLQAQYRWQGLSFGPHKAYQVLW